MVKYKDEENGDGGGDGGGDGDGDGEGGTPDWILLVMF